MPQFLRHRGGVEVKTVVPRHQSALEIFKAMSFSDLVHDGNLLEVVRCLRGSTRLRIPAAWYDVLPKEL